MSMTRGVFSKQTQNIKNGTTCLYRDRSICERVVLPVVTLIASFSNTRPIYALPDL